MSRKLGAQLRMKIELLALEPVGRVRAAPRPRPLQADFRRQVEDEGQVRLSADQAIFSSASNCAGSTPPFAPW